MTFSASFPLFLQVINNSNTIFAQQPKLSLLSWYVNQMSRNDFGHFDLTNRFAIQIIDINLIKNLFFTLIYYIIFEKLSVRRRIVPKFEGVFILQEQMTQFQDK